MIPNSALIRRKCGVWIQPLKFTTFQQLSESLRLFVHLKRSLPFGTEGGLLITILLMNWQRRQFDLVQVHIQVKASSMEIWVAFLMDYIIPFIFISYISFSSPPFLLPFLPSFLSSFKWGNLNITLVLKSPVSILAINYC